MKKYQFLWIVLLFVFLLWGCDKASPVIPETNGTTNPQTDAVEPSPTENNATSPTEKTFPEMMEDASTEGFVTTQSKDNNTPCQIRTRKYRNDATDYIGYALHIEVDTGEQILKKVIEPTCGPAPEESSLFLRDIDGDGIQEILIHHNTGGCGGAGSYHTWVLKVENDDIQVLFDNYDEFDTGFENRFLEGYQMEVKNKFTGYTLVYDVKDRYGEYIDHSEKLPSDKFMIDSFYMFEPKDTDGDGISEILCKQYTSIRMHADYTGTACSVLKFNTQAQAFEVIDAWYEPNTET